MYLLLDKISTPIEKFKVLPSIELSHMKNFISNYFASLHIKGLVQGNITADIAKQTAYNFAKHLKSSPLPEEIYPRVRKSKYFYICLTLERREHLTTI